MIRSLNLKELAPRIEAVDALIMTLVAHRMGLSLNVGAYKKATGEPIFRPEPEEVRIQKIRDQAKALGMNPHFAEALLYNVIGESCKQQMILLQGDYRLPDTKDEKEWYDTLKQNLRDLTKIIAASYDSQYDTGFFGLRSYRDFEDDCIAKAIQATPSRKLAIDLGCATGNQSVRLAKDFDNVVGFDLSSHMIQHARKKVRSEYFASKIRFEECDLESGIPLEDASVSFVLMNLGTASDLPGIADLTKEVARVLVPGGRFLFSFYNKDALVYCWDFLPWPVGLAAEINHKLSCLDVHADHKIFSVFAKGYTVEEVKSLLHPGLVIEPDMLTYPTISPLLPNQIFSSEAEKAEQVVSRLDRALSTLNYGAYIIATGRKD